MRTYHQPSGLSRGIDFLISSEWTPAQALAVIDLLNDLRDCISTCYELAIYKQRCEELGITFEQMCEKRSITDTEDLNKEKYKWDDDLF